MVKFQLSTSKKHYLKGKRVYQYGRVCLFVPSRFFEIIKPFFQQELHANVTAEHGTITITFTNRKTTQQP